MRKEKLQAIVELSDEVHEYQQLVTYHKIRWLSLSECVHRLVDLLPEIVCYFDEESHSTHNRPGERAKLRKMHEELVSAEFQLYLFFLNGQLPILAGIKERGCV